MGEKRREYSREFKIEAVRLVDESGRSKARIARELGIHESLLGRWKTQLEEHPASEAFPGNGRLSAAEEEIRRLRRELEQARQENAFLKKAGSVLREGVAVKYAVIQAHRGQFALSLMCCALQVSRSGFYAWMKREPSEHAAEEQRLRLEIRSIHRASRRSYGSPRVHRHLRERGILCSRKRVERLMREDGLVAKRKRRFRRTTDSNHGRPVAPNLLQRRFSLGEVGGVNRVWVSDITYVPTRQGWLYLAVVLDLASRRVVGWAMKNTLEASLATDAFQMALWNRKPGRGLLHHSDRGVQYASEAYQQILRRHGMICSMSRKGDCFDNAVAESFFATLEWELIQESDWHTHEEARRAVFDYIEVWYNRQRLHSSLGYRSPAQYEAQLTLTPRRAA
ncbi:MAG TPA: IS3 family transposase [Longimicrobiaceae bacterium]|nr:IS3 family transposase [Longimicrobiaceae bacterium]